MLEQPGWLQKEKQLGPYHLKKELSNSKMSVLYLAHDFKQEFRPVVLKCLKTRIDKHAQQVFLYEARWMLLKRMQQKHILCVLDIGVKDDFPYVVVEYTPRGSLRDRLQQHPGYPLSWSEVKRVLLQVGSALSAAHTTMYACHGDLKPERILFNDAGEALVGYFYLTKVHGLASGVPPQTFPYAPPERSLTASPEDDQYALGCMVYEMCTGYQPFVAPNEQAPAMYLQESPGTPRTINPAFMKNVIKSLTEPPASPRSLNPDLPVESERAILKAMALKPEDRYPSIAAFLTTFLQEDISPV